MQTDQEGMNTGEFLTKLTIWVSILAYVTGAFIFAFSHRRQTWLRVARLAWTIACAALLAHVVCTFQVYHGWSHSAAFRDTARQTNEVVGLNWGGGIYFNYVVVVVWIIDVLWWWWSGPGSYRQRPRVLIAAWHAFLIFMIFNATVVFKTGITRWAGLVACICLVVAWAMYCRLPACSDVRETS